MEIEKTSAETLLFTVFGKFKQEGLRAIDEVQIYNQLFDDFWSLTHYVIFDNVILKDVSREVPVVEATSHDKWL